MRIARKVGAKGRGQRHFRSNARVYCIVSLLILMLSFCGAGRARAELTTNGEVAGLRAQFAAINGIRTRYYEAGEGEPLVLVHGEEWSGHASANIWSKDIPLFATRFHVFAPDKLGSGMTDNPTDDNDFNIQGEVDHIYDFIRIMKLGTVHLVGEGRGGDCVFFLALQHPEIVRDLVIVNSNIAAAQDQAEAGPLASCPQEPDDAAWKCRTLGLSRMPEQAFDDEYFMAGKYMSLLPKSLDTAAKLKVGAGGDLATPAGFNQWRNEWLDRIRKEGGLPIPVLLYWGAEDPASPVANGEALRDTIAQQNRRVQLMIAEKAGHYPFREDPEKFVSDVSSFFDWAAHSDDSKLSANPSSEAR